MVSSSKGWRLRILLRTLWLSILETGSFQFALQLLIFFEVYFGEMLKTP
jgi:hypothetical protein